MWENVPLPKLCVGSHKDKRNAISVIVYHLLKKRDSLLAVRWV